jgi:hypothetical protein
MDAPQVMPGAHRDPILVRIGAPLRPELDVMIMQVAAGAARRHGAAPSVPRENRISVSWQRLPFAGHLLQVPATAALAPARATAARGLLTLVSNATTET